MLKRKDKYEQDKEFVKNNYDKYTKTELCKKLKCNYNKLIEIINELGIEVNKKKYRDQRQIDFVLKNYKNMSYEEMAQNLNCAVSTIGSIIGKLGLNKYKIDRNNKIQFLLENKDTMTINEIAYELNITVRRLRQIAKEENITINKIITNNSHKNNTNNKKNDPIFMDKLFDNEQFKNLSNINCSNYYISNYGRIINKDNLLLKYCDTKVGYYIIRLFDDNHEYKNLLIHRLVALMFVHNDDTENKIQVNHIDGNKHNNIADNLEWVTPSQNMKHAIDKGLMKVKKGENGAYVKHTEQDVRNVCEMLQEGKSSKEIIQKYPQYNSLWIQTIKDRRNWKDISKDYNW